MISSRSKRLADAHLCLSLEARRARLAQVAQVAQVAQIYGKAKLPRGVSELNPCLPGFRRPPASRSCAFM